MNTPNPRGQELKQLRQDVGLTQKRLAGLLGVRQDQLSRWENGQDANSDVKTRAAKFFGMVETPENWK